MTSASVEAPTASSVPAAGTMSDALARFQTVRDFTNALCEPLTIEDQVIQSMPDASPTKWHLAHTTWFFETFLLVPHLQGYETPDERYNFLFNSYYNSVGEQYSRPDRGLVSRPTVAEVGDYRRHVDAQMRRLLEETGEARADEILPLVEVGLNHEQQHQELLLTDLKHLLSRNPLHPAYQPAKSAAAAPPPVLSWHGFDEGLYHVGAGSQAGGRGFRHGRDFVYDNEEPRHRVFLEPFRVASRPVTCGEYLEFMADGGYERHEFWLSDGWATIQRESWRAPLYWHQKDGEWLQFTLAGLRPVDPDEPVCHLSFFEADAYAHWTGLRLPSEAEWEVAASAVLGSVKAHGDAAPEANFAEEGFFHPRPLGTGDGARGQFLGDVWEWTRSAYSSYPGYRAPAGALGEYNAKFMNNQIVLRGGSCATSRSHIRSTYRNFFPPHARWQFSGLRLAQDGLS